MVKYEIYLILAIQFLNFNFLLFLFSFMKFYTNNDFTFIFSLSFYNDIRYYLIGNKDAILIFLQTLRIQDRF